MMVLGCLLRQHDIDTILAGYYSAMSVDAVILNKYQNGLAWWMVVRQK